jgi:colanic acid/amylovoran biosynthesis glycosyltransferase
MATGRPVVGTRHAGIPELVEHGRSGLLVPERDPDALAAALADVLGRSDRGAPMGRAGRERVRRDYDSRILADELLEIYRRVVQAGGSR